MLGSTQSSHRVEVQHQGPLEALGVDLEVVQEVSGADTRRLEAADVNDRQLGVGDHFPDAGFRGVEDRCHVGDLEEGLGERVQRSEGEAWSGSWVVGGCRSHGVK